jgi:predicted phosphate transport protein (TIGR00153 family)
MTGARRPMASPRLRTKDSELLALFGRAGRNLRRASELLDRLLIGWPETQDLRDEIRECEHLGDRITHDIIHQLLTSSAGPFDREDVFGLAGALDDVVDFAEEVADYLGLYQIEAPMEAAQQLAGVLRETCAQLADALDGLDDVRCLSPLLIEIHRLENEGDRIVRGAIASLFVGGIDPTVIIRWKDLFERLEDAIDSCEKAAHILEGIAVKNA